MAQNHGVSTAHRSEDVIHPLWVWKGEVTQLRETAVSVLSDIRSS